MDAFLARAGEGDTITDTDERFVQVKADLEELAVTDNRYSPGESGPGPHVHREHGDCFWVLGGELSFELGAGERTTVPAGSFVLVPPEVVHSFRNDGTGDARFLNVHAPSRGFADYLRARRDGDAAADEDFDTFEPPPDGGRPASDALVRLPGEGEELGFGPSKVVFKAGREHGGGGLSLTEQLLGPGFPGPVPHRHETFVDSFYVLEGTLTVRLGGETVEAPPGTYALAPPGAVHTFGNPGEDSVRSLNLMAPGGFEQYLKEVAAATSPGGAPDPQLMASIASKYDFHPVE